MTLLRWNMLKFQPKLRSNGRKGCLIPTLAFRQYHRPAPQSDLSPVPDLLRHLFWLVPFVVLAILLTGSPTLHGADQPTLTNAESHSYFSTSLDHADGAACHAAISCISGVAIGSIRLLQINLGQRMTAPLTAEKVTDQFGHAQDLPPPRV